MMIPVVIGVLVSVTKRLDTQCCKRLGIAMSLCNSQGVCLVGPELLYQFMLLCELL